MSGAAAARRHALAWGAVAALALATHYYAIFLVGPQGLWLALRLPGLRERATALVLPVVAGLALAPLALGQRANEGAAFIGDSELATRLAQLPKQFLVGYDAPVEPLLIALSALAVLAGVAGLAALRNAHDTVSSRARNEIALLAGSTAAALALPVLASLGGEDHLITRNVIAVLPPACALLGGRDRRGGAARPAADRSGPRGRLPGGHGRRRRRRPRPRAAARRLARRRSAPWDRSASRA